MFVLTRFSIVYTCINELVYDQKDYLGRLSGIRKLLELPELVFEDIGMLALECFFITRWVFMHSLANVKTQVFFAAGK